MNDEGCPTRKEVEGALRNALNFGGGEDDSHVIAQALGARRLEFRHDLRLVRLGMADPVMVGRLHAGLGYLA